MEQEKLSEKTSFYIYELEQYYTMSDVLNNKTVNGMPLLIKLMDELPQDDLFKQLSKDMDFLSKIDLEQRDSDGDTLLHLASEMHYDLACALIDAGADVNAENDDYEIPLIQAMHCTGQEESKNLMKKLLDNGSQTLTKDSLGMTPLLNLTSQHPDFLETYFNYIDLDNKDNIEIIKDETNKMSDETSQNKSLIKRTLEQKILEQEFKNNKIIEFGSIVKRKNKML